MENFKLHTVKFWILCTGSMLFFLGFNMLIPELSGHLTQLGGATYKGMIIGLFALVAGFSRPFSGKLTDTIGRIPILVFGAVVSLISGLIYPLISSVMGFFVLRMFHGLSTGFSPTASAAYLADISPVNKRGEAMGYIGIMNNLGLSIGPALGSEVAFHFGLDWLYIGSAVMTLPSIVMFLMLKETLPNKQRLRIQHFKLNTSDYIDTQLWSPALVMLFTVFSFGAVLTLIPDFALHLGLQKQGYFFLALTLTSILIRVIAGRWSDRLGRRPFAWYGVGFLVIGTIIIGFAPNIMWLFIGALVLGCYSGILSPVLFAWAIDLSKPGKSGLAMSTLYLALEAGIVLGSFVSAAIYQNNAENFKWAFLTCALCGLLAMLVLYWHKRIELKKKSK